MMGDTIQQRAGQTLGTELFRPLVKGKKERAMSAKGREARSAEQRKFRVGLLHINL